jgi:hypothetical protein
MSVFNGKADVKVLCKILDNNGSQLTENLKSLGMWDVGLITEVSSEKYEHGRQATNRKNKRRLIGWMSKSKVKV